MGESRGDEERVGGGRRWIYLAGEKGGRRKREFMDAVKEDRGRPRRRFMGERRRVCNRCNCGRRRRQGVERLAHCGYLITER